MNHMLIDAYPEDAVTTLLAFVAGQSAYLLIDQAQATAECAYVLRALPAVAFTRIFEGRYAGDDVADVSPLLLALPNTDAEREAFIRRWLRITTGLPMLSAIKTDQPLPVVNRHFQNQLEAAGPDDTAYILRWADTRCLALLRDVLTQSQQLRLMSTLTAWAWFDRGGHWVVMQGEPDSAEPTREATEPYRLDDAQIQAIQDASLADTLLRHLYHSRQGLVFRVTPSRVHASIEQTLMQLRDEYGALPPIAACSRPVVQALLKEKQAATHPEA